MQQKHLAPFLRAVSSDIHTQCLVFCFNFHFSYLILFISLHQMLSLKKFFLMQNQHITEAFKPEISPSNVVRRCLLKLFCGSMTWKWDAFAKIRRRKKKIAEKTWLPSLWLSFIFFISEHFIPLLRCSQLQSVFYFLAMKQLSVVIPDLLIFKLSQAVSSGWYQV